jgi:protein-S-isoprenylcysteine O-methyltransferase Ste14
MELKLPPIVVFLVFGILMYGLATFLPVGQFEFFGRTYLLLFLMILALLIGSISLMQFYLAKTTIDPVHPEKVSNLVTSGPYAFSRNPMYLALLLVLLAWGLYLGNAFNVLLAAGFVSFMNHFQIQAEERILSQKFKNAYAQYCIKVRRWF